MSHPILTIGNYPTIEEDLRALQEHILEYRSAINQEGIWLFLATVACWGIPQPVFQYCAFLLVAFLFGERLNARSTESRSFSELAKSVERRIAETIPEEDTRKARLYDLAELQRAQLSKIHSFKRAKIFFLCWGFYGASLIYIIWPN